MSRNPLSLFHIVVRHAGLSTYELSLPDVISELSLANSSCTRN